jgi:superfamily II DNA/RNA helicase
MTFDDLALAPEILRAISDVGYSTPTPIQEKAIPEVLAGRDVLGIAQTGTGKTASFTLPMIHRLMKGRAKARMPRTLILEPTRELAAQVAENFDLYGKYTRLNKALLIGGVAFGDQEKAIERGADVLIATPGRLLDHVERGKVLLRGVEILVIDEADRMLDMGFIPDIERIVKLLPFTRQTLFFSATMPPEITRLSDQFLQAPARVEVSRPAAANDAVSQFVVHTSQAKKTDILKSLFRSEDVKNGIIFCNRKRDIGTLLRALETSGFNVCALHGDMDQHMRLRQLESFRAGEKQYLIASDVAARGLDIPDVSHVFNFDTPTHAEDYVHRIGRTGRAGRSGRAFCLVTSQDEKYLSAIESLIKLAIPKHDMGEPEPTSEAKAERPHKEPRKQDKRAPKRRGLLSKPADEEAPAGAPAPQEKMADPKSTAAQKSKGKQEKPKASAATAVKDKNVKGEKKQATSDAFEGATPAFLSITISK